MIRGTIAFSVSREEHRPSWDNSDVISEIIRRRRPGLVVCAGWSVRGVADLESVRAATKRAKTVVVLETTNPKRYLTVGAGLARKMGKQIFAYLPGTDKRRR